MFSHDDITIVILHFFFFNVVHSVMLRESKVVHCEWFFGKHDHSNIGLGHKRVGDTDSISTKINE